MEKFCFLFSNVFFKNCLKNPSNKFQSKLLEDPSEKREPAKVPGRAVLIENKVVEEKPFFTNDELPEAELYFGGEKETESEHDLRMIKISQQEEMSRL